MAAGLTIRTDQWLDIYNKAMGDLDRFADALRHLSLRTDILPGDRQWALLNE